MKTVENPASDLDRAALVARGRRLEYLTIGWNSFEAAVALISGVLAGSIALVGFGLDSVIETASAAILLWRFAGAEGRERTARRLVGAGFLLLAAYVAAESVRALWLKAQPERSLPGILITIAAVIVMPLLGRAKRRVAAQLKSDALHSDSRQADFCAYLSAIVSGGPSAARIAGLVVGRSCRRAGHGAHHRARRSAGAARRKLRVRTLTRQ